MTELPLKAPSTQDRYRSVIRRYLDLAFGESCLRDITTQSVQQYFSALAQSPLSQESKDKIRDVLSSILDVPSGDAPSRATRPSCP